MNKTIHLSKSEIKGYNVTDLELAIMRGSNEDNKLHARFYKFQIKNCIS
jgi:hypothetical protein